MASAVSIAGLGAATIRLPASIWRSKVASGIDLGRGSYGRCACKVMSMDGAAHSQVSVPAWQRRLLPGDTVTTGRWRRSVRDWVVDVALVISALAVGFGFSSEWWRSGPSTTLLVLDVAAGVTAVMLLWWRRQHPVAIAIPVLLLASVSLAAGSVALIVALNAAIRVRSWRVLGAITAAALTSCIIVSTIHGEALEPVGLGVGLLLFAVLVGWGLFVRAQRDLVISLHQHAERMEQDRAGAEERARDAERRRIAREMHDVLAHRISMLGLHAGALEYRGSSATPAEVAEAAGVIRSSATEAMQELREVIGLLRSDDAERGIEPPQPTLARIPQLIDESRGAGVRIDATIDPLDDADVPAAAQLAAYRVVQEGLTNARRHAPGSRVEVRLAHGAIDLLVEVVTRTGLRPAAASGDSEAATGAGLVGLRERVTLLGGRLDHGVDERGDFHLTATLPLTA
jgi:signal transduction histidine kinase